MLECVCLESVEIRVCAVGELCSFWQRRTVGRRYGGSGGRRSPLSKRLVECARSGVFAQLQRVEGESASICEQFGPERR